MTPWRGNDSLTGTWLLDGDMTPSYCIAIFSEIACRTHIYMSIWPQFIKLVSNKELNVIKRILCFKLLKIKFSLRFYSDLSWIPCSVYANIWSTGTEKWTCLRRSKNTGDYRSFFSKVTHTPGLYFLFFIFPEFIIIHWQPVYLSQKRLWSFIVKKRIFICIYGFFWSEN